MYALIPLVGPPHTDPLTVKLLDNRLCMIPNIFSLMVFVFIQSFSHFFIHLVFYFLVLWIWSAGPALSFLYEFCTVNFFSNILTKYDWQIHRQFIQLSSNQPFVWFCWFCTVKICPVTGQMFLSLTHSLWMTTPFGYLANSQLLNGFWHRTQ